MSEPRYTPPPPFAPYAAPQVPYPGPYVPPAPAYGFGFGPVAAPQRPTLMFGTVGASIGGIGFLLVAIAFVGLPWFSAVDTQTTGDIRDFLTARGEIANQLSVAYFSWFGWLLLILATGASALAALPRPGLSLAFRIAGPLASAFAVMFTVGAVELTSAVYGDAAIYYSHLSYGFWLALIGFALTGVGSLIGPKRVYSDLDGDGPSRPSAATFGS